MLLIYPFQHNKLAAAT